MVLLQYNAKPYLGFQNLGCHYKILGCHFDTQKRLKKTLVATDFKNMPLKAIGPANSTVQSVMRLHF